MTPRIIIRYIVVPIVIIIILAGAGSLCYKIYKSNKQKRKVLEKVDQVQNDLKNLNNLLQTNTTFIINKYESDNKEIDSSVKENNFVLFDENNLDKYDNPIIIEIGDKKYIKEFPTNLTEMSNTILAMQKTINKINKARKDDYNYFLKTMTNTIEHVYVIQTNVVELREEVTRFVKPKLFSYGVGVGVAFEGISQTKEIMYRVSAHGTLYILDSWYVGLELGVAYNYSYNPVLGVFAGAKF